MRIDRLPAKLKLVAAMVVVILTSTACETVSSVSTTPTSWTLAYANNADGTALSGSKKELIRSIQSGAAVRIYIGDESFGHSADAAVLTVFEGDVFAQLSPIESQAPTNDPKQMLFRKPGIKWRAIIGTNGFFTALMDGNDPNIRQGSAKWFIQK